MTFSEVVQHVLDRVPDLRPVYEAEVVRWSEDPPPGAYIVFEDMLRPILVGYLNRDSRGRAAALNILDALETIAAEGDEQCADLLRIAIGEGLVNDCSRETLGRILLMAGPETRRILSDSLRQYARIDAAKLMERELRRQDREADGGRSHF